VAAAHRVGILFEDDNVAAVPLEVEAVEQACEGAPDLKAGYYLSAN
jgi:hypothetical protein